MLWQEKDWKRKNVGTISMLEQEKYENYKKLKYFKPFMIRHTVKTLKLKCEN